MDRTMERNERIAQERRRNKLLIALAALVLVCGLFAQITVRAQVSGRAKEIAAVQAQIRTLNAEVANLTMCINQHHNIDEIGKRALTMGMIEQKEGQVRSIALSSVNTPTQTVANIDGEEING